ncbi:MAG: GNAT family N-acetyltransferase [Desulfobacula sp.]|nr:GNAT family N-acetyltransferase [Desulfobacula sp.]
MISKVETIEEILPVFRTYLGFMSRFYNITNVNAWRDKALENLQNTAKTEKPLIYSLKKSNDIIGFAQINKHLRFNYEGLAIAEFYVQKEYEKNGYGTTLAEHVFDLFPGSWEVAVAIKNEPARVFWKQVVSSYTSGKFTEKRKNSMKECGLLFNNEQGRYHRPKSG